MLTTSQILTVVGLVFEFISVLITIRKLFWGYHKRLSGKMPIQVEISKDRIEGIIVLTFLIVGMGLQGLAVLLS